MTIDSFKELRQQITSDPHPVYLIHGEDGYYADRVYEDFVNLVPEDARDFNLNVLYGPDVNGDDVINAARCYPVLSPRLVVILKEAQAMRADQLNRLNIYVNKPCDTTILAILCRGADAKGRDLLAAARKNAVVFQAKKLTDYSVGPLINEIVAEKGLTIDAKATAMLRDYIGTDLSRLHNEIEKLSFILGHNARITPEAIERNIGISKDFNNFELIEALNSRNLAKAFQITNYFAANPKTNPTVVTAATLFNHFSGLLAYQYLPDKSLNGAREAMGVRSDWQLRKYQQAASQFSPRQVVAIISAIRKFDANSKGIGSRQNEYSLLHDLIFTILTV